MPAASVGSGVDVGGRVTVAVGRGGSVGASVARGGVPGGAADTTGDRGIGAGEDAGNVAPTTGSGVPDGRSGSVRAAVFNQREFASSITKISTATPTPAIPIQRYLPMKGGAVVADSDVAFAGMAAGGDVRCGVADDDCPADGCGGDTAGGGTDREAEGGADDARRGVADDDCPADGCGGDAAGGGTDREAEGGAGEAEGCAGGAGVDTGTGGRAAALGSGVGAEAAFTSATTRRNAVRRSFSCSATSASARHTHGLSGQRVASMRSSARARRVSPCWRKCAAFCNNDCTITAERGLCGGLLIL